MLEDNKALDLTIAMCTRNRPGPLVRALRAAATDASATQLRYETLVIDDGELPPELIAEMQALVQNLGGEFGYHRKPDSTRGLYRSRKVAVDLSSARILLFLDDDAEIEPGYMALMMRTFRTDASLSGIGGIDRLSLPLGNGHLGEAYAKTFLMSSGEPGRLSQAGMNFSQSLWRGQRDKFESEFLHGCNMAFRRAAIADLPDLPWLEGHSPGEDLVLSVVAARKGRLVVDPALGVEHACEPGGRGGAGHRMRVKLANAARFQCWRLGRSRPGLAMFWAGFGMAIKDLAFATSGRWAAVDVLTGYAYAFKEMVTEPGSR